MTLLGVCIYTDDAPRLAAFYETALEETPRREGTHYGFDRAQLAVFDPGDATVPPVKCMSLMFAVPDLPAAYARLLRDIPGLAVESPPQRRPWGAYSFQFRDPDGNLLSFVERKPAEPAPETEG